jgi:hypothetical protein
MFDCLWYSNIRSLKNVPQPDTEVSNNWIFLLCNAYAFILSWLDILNL